MRSLVPTSLFVAALAVGFASAPAARADQHEGEGGSSFQEQCASCHGAEGKADTAVGRAMDIPAFPGSEWAEAEPSAICDRVKDVPQHAAMLKKLEAQELTAACQTVKELAAAEG